MKKQATFLAVLSTAVFTASMAFPAYAKTAGWTEKDGNWYYYDSYGDPLTDTWKKSGNDWYYLNSEGVRAYSEQIDEYYVNEEGNVSPTSGSPLKMKITGTKMTLLNFSITTTEKTEKP